MLPATMIAEFLNVGMTSVHGAIEAGSVELALCEHGGRPVHMHDSRKLLVVDDTCFHGNSITATKKKLWHDAFQGYEIIFLVVYLEGPCDKASPDIWLRDIREEAKGGPFGWAMYEWNIFAHGRLTDRTLFDLDGVICVEPPDERDVEKYESYIEKPIPLYVPTCNVINICTYRREMYRDVTIESLRVLGFKNINLFMSDRSIPSAKQKAEIYKDEKWLLFIESSRRQALEIHLMTGKPVICIDSNELFV